MKRTFLIILLLPSASIAQPSLTGVWRLQDSKVIKGPDYTNELPHTITIQKIDKKIVLKSLINTEGKDRVLREELIYGNKSITESKTQSGKKKRVSFSPGEDSSSWIKKTEVFAGADTGTLQSVNKEIFRVAAVPNGHILRIVREYDGNELLQGYSDFVIDLLYVKVTREQLDQEIATGKGVKFAEGLTWEQIKAKAKKENKYIFVDCYATWCKPCRLMDKYVFPLNSVGTVMNKHFIPVKVQMDTGKNDPSAIKMLYGLARRLEKEHDISALPTYLFFSSDGQIVHKAMGQQDVTKFIKLLVSVQKPEQQLYTLANKAQKKELAWKEYPALIEKLRKEFGEKALANEIASVYNKFYLNTLSETELLSKEHLGFIVRYVDAIVNSSDKYFKLFLNQPALVDSLAGFGVGYADWIVGVIINREEILPLFNEAAKTTQDPNWEMLEQQLVTKYNREFAVVYTLKARLDWYEKKKNWVSFFRYLRPYLATQASKKDYIYNIYYLNRSAWKVFEYSEDKVLMEDALEWIDIAIQKGPKQRLCMYMDTKACLLYKIGKKDEGIDLMEKLEKLDPDSKERYKFIAEKMKKNEAIWQILH